MTTNKLILGFTGQIASGKGTAAKYLENKYNASTYKFSTPLRDILHRAHIEENRQNLQTLSRIMRENFGEDILAKIIAEDVKNESNKFIIIDGIRRPSDIIYLEKIQGFVLANIFADIEKRFERITSRNENSDDSKKTFEEFQKDNLGESELKISEIAEKATEKIDNNGSINDLYANLDNLVKKYSDV
jgi:dephospho-CoA kinase